jgi:hypothetical protein
MVRVLVSLLALVTGALVTLVLLRREHFSVALVGVAQLTSRSAASFSESPLLAHVFMGIVFNWNVQKLVHVKTVRADHLQCLL